MKGEPNQLFVSGGFSVTNDQIPDSVQFSSVQSLSRVRLCDFMNHSTPGLLVHHQLPEFTQTHVHRVSDAIQPSHPLSLPSPPAPNPSQHQSLFQYLINCAQIIKTFTVCDMDRRDCMAPGLVWWLNIIKDLGSFHAFSHTFSWLLSSQLQKIITYMNWMADINTAL